MVMRQESQPTTQQKHSDPTTLPSLGAAPLRREVGEALSHPVPLQLQLLDSWLSHPS